MKAPGWTSTPKRCPLSRQGPHQQLQVQVGWGTKLPTAPLTSFAKIKMFIRLSTSPTQFGGRTSRMVASMRIALRPDSRAFQTELKSTQNIYKNTQKNTKVPKTNTKTPSVHTIKLPQIYFFHFGIGMRVGTTPPARKVGGDFFASFQKSRFFISEASPIARCWACWGLFHISFRKWDLSSQRVFLVSGWRIFPQFLNRVFLQLELFDYKYKWTKATQEVLLRKLPFKISAFDEIDKKLFFAKWPWNPSSCAFAATDFFLGKKNEPSYVVGIHSILSKTPTCHVRNDFAMQFYPVSFHYLHYRIVTPWLGTKAQGFSGKAAMALG